MYLNFTEQRYNLAFPGPAERFLKTRLRRFQKEHELPHSKARGGSFKFSLLFKLRNRIPPHRRRIVFAHLRNEEERLRPRSFTRVSSIADLEIKPIGRAARVTAAWSVLPLRKFDRNPLPLFSFLRMATTHAELERGTTRAISNARRSSTSFNILSRMSSKLHGSGIVAHLWGRTNMNTVHSDISPRVTIPRSSANGREEVWRGIKGLIVFQEDKQFMAL